MRGRDRKTIGRAAFAAAIIGIALALTGCHRTPDEQQVRGSIDSAAIAARSNATRGVLAVVADDFTGNDGELDRHGLHQLLALRQDHTGVLIGPVSFRRKGDRIIATFNLVLTGGKAGDLLPARSAIYAMTTAWRRDGGRWRCYAATWRPTPGGD